jgi:coenzyme Q-binding protein COQ10
VDWSPDDKPFDLEAELMVGFGGLEEVYTSRVVGKPFESVTVSLHLPTLKGLAS